MLECFLDHKDVIVIKSNKESTFTINNEPIEVIYINKKDGIITYKSFYHININNSYIIKDEENNECKLAIRYYLKDDSFDKEYFYNGNDLGANYHPKQTIFKVWAPIASKVILHLEKDEYERILPMEKKEKGIYSICVKGNLEEALYYYEIINNGISNNVIDPYAYSSNSNSKKSAVINFKKLKKIKETPIHNKINNINECIIYELSVRDYSMSGVFGKEIAGKYKAFSKDIKIQGQDIGLNYIKSLGVTHIQLMPILDFATVNEDDIKESYNWGYDPLNYGVMEGSYSMNPNDPYLRINETKEMIASIHNHGLRVILDVVFNHTYLYNSIYNKIVPYYAYLMDENGTLSNGSFCGNDLDTTRLMVRKYFIDICLRLVSLYHIDGLRFDLMGILDKSLVLEIYKACKAINPNFICYGEGWNMPSFLPYEKRCIIKTNKELPFLSFFNDSFRDKISGKVNGEKGYLNGNTSLFYEFIKMMKGSIEEGCYFTNPSSSINYVECHDNYTLFDKLNIINKNLTSEKRNRLQLMNIAAVIFALGVPFLHAGMEFNRSKKGVENSYNSSDEINMINWEDIILYKDNIKALKDFISIRKEFDLFRLNDPKIILKSIDSKVSKEGMVRLLYAYKGKVLMLAFNPTFKKIPIKFVSEYYHIANTYGKIKDERTYDGYDFEAFSFNIFSK